MVSIIRRREHRIPRPHAAPLIAFPTMNPRCFPAVDRVKRTRVMMRLRRGCLALMLSLMSLSATAACDDPPARGVIWSGCGAERYQTEHERQPNASQAHDDAGACYSVYGGKAFGIHSWESYQRCGMRFWRSVLTPPDYRDHICSHNISCLMNPCSVFSLRRRTHKSCYFLNHTRSPKNTLMTEAAGR